MATKAAELFAEVGAETTQYERKMRQVGQTFEKTTRDMKQQADQMAGAIAGGLGGIAGALGVGGALMLGKQVAGFTWDLAQAGMQVQALERNFVALSGEGIASLEGLRRATRSMVSDADLLQSTNQYLAMGLADTSKQAGDLIGVATQLALIMGRDVSGAVGEFAQLLANQSMMRLDQFGIGAERVRQRMEALQKANASLSKEQAFTNAVLAEAEVTIARAGDQAGNTASKAAILSASWANLRTEVGKGIDSSPVLDFAEGVVEDIADRHRERNERRQQVDELDELVQQLERAGIIGSESLTRIRTQANLLNHSFREGLSHEQYVAGIAALIAALEREAWQLDLTAEAAMREHDAIREATAAHQDMAAALAGEKATQAAVRKGYHWKEDPFISRMMGGSAVMNDYENRDVIALENLKKLQDARGQYQWASADTAGQIEILRQQIAGVTEGTAEWYNLNTQLVGLEARQRSEIEATNKSLRSRQETLAKQSEAQFRSLVEGVLSPTRVSDLDMARTKLGTYTDQWDEHIRRVRSAATDSQSVWKGLIPTDVLARGTDAVKVWAAETEEAFYAGQMPDMVNWDAVMADIEKQMRYATGREALVQEAMQRARAAGLGVSVGQVREALGVGQTYSEIGQDVASGMTAGMGGVNIAAQVTTTFEADLKKQQERYVTQGQLMVSWLATGVKDGTPALASDLALALFPALQRLFANASPRL